MPVRTLAVPYLQGLAANAVENGQKAGLKSVLEHTAPSVPGRGHAGPVPVGVHLCSSARGKRQSNVTYKENCS